MRTSWLLILTCHEISCCKYELLMSAKNRWLYNTVAMEMFVVFNIPPFCSLDSFASHLFRVFVHLNTIKKQGLSRDLRSPSAIFCLVFIWVNTVTYRPFCYLSLIFFATNLKFWVFFRLQFNDVSNSRTIAWKQILQMVQILPRNNQKTLV